jgi:hypothetical protein
MAYNHVYSRPTVRSVNVVRQDSKSDIMGVALLIQTLTQQSLYSVSNQIPER